MATPENNQDEPLTPTGRLFLRPEINIVIHCIVGLKDPIDIEAFKLTINNSMMIRLPRFRSLLVHDSHGVEHWRETKVDVDRHIIIVNEPVIIKPTSTDGGDDSNFSDECKAAANHYVAEFAVDTPLSQDKPLWEIHVLTAHRCLVFKGHHALGDGISMMSMLLACCRRKDNPEALPSTVFSKKRKGNGNGKKGVVWLWDLVKMVWFSLVYLVEFVSRCLWIRDRNTVIYGGVGVELWPKKIVTASFSIQDMKLVKSVLPNATINDVLIAVVTSGISRYFDQKSFDGISKKTRVTGTVMFSLREQPGLQELSDMIKENTRSKWGNKFGFLLLPLYCKKDEPLQYLKDAKTMIDKKKNSFEAYFSYHLLDLVMSWFGLKNASRLAYRIASSTSFILSNVVGPPEEILIDGNLVTYLRVSTSGNPQPLSIHMVSYAGKVDMQMSVAKDIIQEPQLFAKCFEDAFLDMKKLAIFVTENKNTENV